MPWCHRVVASQPPVTFSPPQASQTLPDGRVRARNLLLSEKMLPVRASSLDQPRRGTQPPGCPCSPGSHAPSPALRKQGESWRESAERAVAEELGSAFKGKPSGAHFREETVSRMNVSKESPSYPGAPPAAHSRLRGSRLSPEIFRARPAAALTSPLARTDICLSFAQGCGRCTVSQPSRGGCRGSPAGTHSRRRSRGQARACPARAAASRLTTSRSRC